MHELPYCWYRKRFNVDDDLKGLDCLLRIVDVRWSAEVWLNGVSLGKHVGGYTPFHFDATDAIRPGEENVAVIKVGGGHTIPRYDDGIPKIPFGNVGWSRGASGIMGDIELCFFRDVTISRVKIDSDIHSGTCTAAVRLTNHGSETRSVVLGAKAYEKKSGRTASESYTAPAEIAPGENKSLVFERIKIENHRLWSPEDPFLYYLDLAVKDAETVCDRIHQTFGMREFLAKEGGFFLNGKRIFLRGATDLAITGFPSWGMPAAQQIDPAWIKKYLIDDAREMNVNCFRTHMGPWYAPYYDIADEHGMLIIGEFPNWPPEGGPNYYHRPGFVPRLHADCELIAASLWNHPSIIIWAACNEPYGDYDEDENKFLMPFFRNLDPTRPIMRAGAVSDDIADQHCYQGFWTGTIGDVVRASTALTKRWPDKPVCDTEYLETSVRKFGDPDWGRAQKWMGYNVTVERAEKVHALFAMEQTEIKRQQLFDGLLPFWYGMWVSKDSVLGGEKWMTYYALKNALAPVAVSIGLIDRHFVAASDLKLQVWTMNDLQEKQRGSVSVYVVSDDPPYIYAGEPESALASQTFDVDISPHSAVPHDVTLSLPSREGSYYLLATLRVPGRETVISKRPIHVLDREKSLAAARGASVAIIEPGSAVRGWAEAAGVDVRAVDGFDYRVLVIGKDALTTDSFGQSVREWVNSGGRLIILDQEAWPSDLLGVTVKKAGSDVSYLFKEKGHEADPVWENIADAYMENWNGSGAEGLTHRFDKTAGGATLAIGSGGGGGLNSIALLRLNVGSGEVLACQIRIAERLTPGTALFDPVAERLMVNLMAAGAGD